ncbi:MAG: hypothetical protein R3254_05930 [Thiomicrorhabdus sp.]|nr:hypothetical protein [Thiomicrorhabdus sp.]
MLRKMMLEDVVQRKYGNAFIVLMNLTIETMPKSVGRVTNDHRERGEEEIMIKKYRKKPIVIEAIRWDASAKTFENIMDMGLKDWSPGSMGGDYFYIDTLEGKMKVSNGDYVIKDVQGEFYPCKPDIFKQIYEEATNETDRA